MSDKEDKKDKNHDSKRNKSLAERTSWIEWLVAAIGLVLVVFSIGYVSYATITSGNEPPKLVVEITSVKPQNSNYLVTFEVTNKGDLTASNIVIEGKLSTDGKTTETRTANIKYLAPQSVQKGGLLYTSDPNSNKLELQATSYVEP